jgi:hypothetical protein
MFIVSGLELALMSWKNKPHSRLKLRPEAHDKVNWPSGMFSIVAVLFALT